MNATAGFEELDHTADWALKVWASDLAGVLEQAARGMYALLGVQLQPGAEVARALSLSADDPEHLLVQFLTELLFIAEEERLAFEQFDLALDGLNLNARLSGRPIASQQKEIKAVTYHGLQVTSTAHGLEATVVFDV